MGRRIAPLTLASLLLASLLLAACGSGETAAEPEPPAGSTATSGAGEQTVEPEPPAASTSTSGAAARIEGVGLDGEPISLADFRGRPVLVNVWSSW